MPNRLLNCWVQGAKGGIKVEQWCEPSPLFGGWDLAVFFPKRYECLGNSQRFSQLTLVEPLLEPFSPMGNPPALLEDSRSLTVPGISSGLLDERLVPARGATARAGRMWGFAGVLRWSGSRRGVALEEG
jgi:hypothetical protein